MALMARELGLPSRVVLGFLPKDEDGDITNARGKKTSGSGTEITFTGDDITAWVEIKLRNLGWVAFYPTPKESKIPDDSQSSAPPDPKNLVRQPPVPFIASVTRPDSGQRAECFIRHGCRSRFI